MDDSDQANRKQQVLARMQTNLKPVHAGWGVKGAVTMGSSMEFPQKIQIEPAGGPPTPPLVHMHEDQEPHPEDVPAAMLTAALFTAATRCTHPTCPRVDGRITWPVHTADYYSALKRRGILHMLQHG